MRTSRALLPATLAVLASLLGLPETRGAAPEGTRAIEQDWRVELYSVSDPARITCPLFISAFTIPGWTSLFQVTWNHRDQPDFQEGGIQLQAYRQILLLEQVDVLTPPWRDKLSSNSEVVTWTQRAEASGDRHLFTVKNIVGTTWGTIPGPYQVARRFLLWAPGLEAYDPAAIDRASGIMMGSNRFKNLAITETRFYNLEGTLLLRDAQARVLFSQPQVYQYFAPGQLHE